MRRLSGHLFLVHGDLRALACDAWLLPTDGAQHLSLSWRNGAPPGAELPRAPKPPKTWGSGQLRKWPDWSADRGVPWFAAIGGGPKDPAWLAAHAEEWVVQIAADLAGGTPRHRRARHLVALPIVGTGYGGHRRVAGELLAHLVPRLERAAARLGIDLALVTNQPEAFAAAQRLRGVGAERWRELPKTLRDAARSLGRLAQRGELVVFMGAGVGTGAGLPTWDGLLSGLAADLGLTPSARDGWARLDALDQAAILQRRCEQRAEPRTLGQLVAEKLWRPEASLSHVLLAGLPVRELVTTNYDDLFERLASLEPVSVLPHRPHPTARRWLLKMHGCVSRPEDIVLTREDYLRYEQRRAALSGIVQALLMTRQMLFVGFSLNDDNFHKIADAVRRARAPSTDRGDGAGAQFGHVLELFPEGYVRELWARDLAFHAMGSAVPLDERTPERWAERARTLELFLDCVLAHAGHAPTHFLSERFSGSLDEGERQLRDALRAMLASLPDGARRGPAWDRVARLVAELGGDPEKL
jgi:hypothetical protein